MILRLTHMWLLGGMENTFHRPENVSRGNRCDLTFRSKFRFLLNGSGKATWTRLKKEVAKVGTNREITRYEKSAFSCSLSHC